MPKNGLKGQEVYNNQYSVLLCHLGRKKLNSSTSHLEGLQIFIQYALQCGLCQRTFEGYLRDSLVQCHMSTTFNNACSLFDAKE